MQLPWQGLKGFSGATAIGSIVLVDVILFANVFADNLFPLINLYAKTPTWAIVTAIPLIALAYLMGLLTIGAGEAILFRFHVVDQTELLEDSIRVSRKGDAIIGHYSLLRQEADILIGSAFAFGILSLSSATTAWKIYGWWRLLAAIAIVACLLAFLSVYLSKVRHTSAHRLAALSESLPSTEIGANP